MKKFIKALAIVLCLSMVTPVVAPSIGVETVEAATKVKLNCTKKTIKEGESFNLKITGTKKKVKWSSSNKKIATVSSKGVVKGIKEGKTTITATVDKKTLKCTIKVVDSGEPNFRSYFINDYGDDSYVFGIAIENNGKYDIEFKADESTNFLGIYYPYGGSYYVSAYLCDEDFDRATSYVIPANSKGYLSFSLEDKEYFCDDSNLFTTFYYNEEEYYVRFNGEGGATYFDN